MKNKLAFLCALSLSLLLAVPALATAETQTFSDVTKDNWAFTYVERLNTSGIVTGTGGGQFSPNKSLTNIEFLIMVERAFADELEIKEAEFKNQRWELWHQPYMDAAQSRGLLYKTSIKATTEGSLAGITRYDMARILNTVYKGEAPSKVDLESAKSKITDYNVIPEQYQEVVAKAYALGFLSGYQDGSFGGNKTMVRSEACKVICKLLDSKTEANTPNTPEQPVKPAVPLDPSESLVGKVLETETVLSLSTHLCPSNYWADAPADVREATDKDAYNAFVQSYKDRDLIATQFPNGLTTRTIPTNYNFAVFNHDISRDGGKKVSDVMGFSGKVANGYSSNTVASDVNKDNDKLSIFFGAFSKDRKKWDTRFAPIFAQFTPGMSDSDKIEVMVQAICDEFSYGAGSGFDWFTERKIGMCGDYQDVLGSILSAAGYDVIKSTGSNHAWSEVYVPDLGQWLVVDATTADVFPRDMWKETCVLVPYETYHDLLTYNDGNAEGTRIVKCMIDAARE